MVVHLKSSLMYSKPYKKRVDNLQMLASYQPPKFQQFEGKGNSKQHIAHFVETCNNAGTERDLLWKNLFLPFEGMPSIGMPILSLNPLTIKSKWKKSF